MYIIFPGQMQLLQMFVRHEGKTTMSLPGGLIALLVLCKVKKTSVMTTPKCLGAHIWQICLADLPPANRAYIP